MKKRLILLSVVVAGTLSASGLAVGEAKQHFEFGYLGSSGNSDSKTLQAKYGAEYRFGEKDELSLSADAFYGENNGDKSDERYRGTAKYTRFFNDENTWYGYLDAGALRNVFEGYDQQYNAGIGTGYAFIDDSTQTLKGAVGYQFRLNNYTDGTDEDQHYAKASLAYAYRFGEGNEVSSGASILEDLENEDNYEAVLNVAMKTGIVENLFLRVGFEAKYDNEPALDGNGDPLEKTDTTTTVGVEYDF